MAAHEGYLSRLDDCWNGKIVPHPREHPFNRDVLGLDVDGVSSLDFAQTANYQAMLAASWAWRVLAQGDAADPAERREAFRVLVELYRLEEEDGLWRGECDCPEPHDSMHRAAHVAVAAAASRWRRPKLLDLAINCLGRALRLDRLTMAPDGEPWRGGARTRTASPRRFGAAAVLRELLRLPQRTERGDVEMKIRGRKVAVTADTLGTGVEADYYRPLRWLRILLAERPTLRARLLELSETGPLPRLRYAATLYRADSGILWVYDRPRDLPRHLLGDFCDWVRVTWGKPCQHDVEAGKAWATPAPAPPPGAKVIRIAGGG